MRRRSAVWALAGALLLAGCAGGNVPPTSPGTAAAETTGAAPSPSDSPGPSPTACIATSTSPSSPPPCDPVPSAAKPKPTTPVPSGSPVALDSLVLSTTGLGRYTWGTRFPTSTPATDPIIWFPGYCAGMIDPGSGSEDLWATAYETWHAEAYWNRDAEGRWVAMWSAGYWGGPFGFHFVPGSTALDLVQLRDASMVTDQGIHIGSSVAELLRAYPGAQWHPLSSGFDGTGTYVVRAASGSLHFAVSDTDPMTGTPSDPTVWQIFGSADPNQEPMSTLYSDGNYMLACMYA